MEITEVRIKLMDDPQERLKAFCSITLDSSFVVRDLKIIQGTRGDFVAMPSRKLTDRCPRCHTKNQLRAHYCNQCGAKLDEERAVKDDDGRAKLYADIAHPIKSECRDMIQSAVLEALRSEMVRAQEDGYTCTYDDYGEENFATLDESETAAQPTATPQPIATPDGRSRRIEPAANGQPQPHHAHPRRDTPAAAHAATGDVAVNEDDPFGDGIL
ncbi:MAG: SpoVG family protein [Planctomycetaceae bacterium]